MTRIPEGIAALDPPETMASLAAHLASIAAWRPEELPPLPHGSREQRRWLKRRLREIKKQAKLRRST